MCSSWAGPVRESSPHLLGLFRHFLKGAPLFFVFLLTVPSVKKLVYLLFAQVQFMYTTTPRVIRGGKTPAACTPVLCLFSAACWMLQNVTAAPPCHTAPRQLCGGRISPLPRCSAPVMQRSLPCESHRGVCTAITVQHIIQICAAYIHQSPRVQLWWWRTKAKPASTE